MMGFVAKTVWSVYSFGFKEIFFDTPKSQKNITLNPQLMMRLRLFLPHKKDLNHEISI